MSADSLITIGYDDRMAPPGMLASERAEVLVWRAGLPETTPDALQRYRELLAEVSERAQRLLEVDVDTIEPAFIAPVRSGGML